MLAPPSPRASHDTASPTPIWSPLQAHPRGWRHVRSREMQESPQAFPVRHTRQHEVDPVRPSHDSSEAAQTNVSRIFFITSSEARGWKVGCGDPAADGAESPSDPPSNHTGKLTGTEPSFLTADRRIRRRWHPDLAPVPRLRTKLPSITHNV